MQTENGPESLQSTLDLLLSEEEILSQQIVVAISLPYSV